MLHMIMKCLPQVVVVPIPAQGHVGPMMKISLRLSDHGIKVTFVVPQSIHARVLASRPDKDEVHSLIEIVSIPDGSQSGDAKMNIQELMLKIMPGDLEDMIKRMNFNDDAKVSCVISDQAWVLESAKNLGVKRAMFWPSLVPGLALCMHAPKLIQEGVLDERGFPMKNGMFQISSNIPAMDASEILWSVPDNPDKQQFIFKQVLRTSKSISISNWLLCNSFSEHDPMACDSIPNLLPIGPLHLGSNSEQPPANFWPEDSTCISWLNEQPARSVIYVAFGSSTNFSQEQFEELALGLELIAQPFLWVIRSDFIKESSANFRDGLLERLAIHGKMVKWAPQEKVLAHPSIACFLTHCGWNSTMEGLSMGVPFLCWPHFADQFLIKRYICNIWKTGLGFDREEKGTISRHEIKSRMKELLCNDEIRTNSLKLRQMAAKSLSEGGSSSNNFQSFVQQLML